MKRNLLGGCTKKKSEKEMENIIRVAVYFTAGDKRKVGGRTGRNRRQTAESRRRTERAILFV